MNDDGVECLAKSEYDGSTYSLAFNTAALRDEYLREIHEARPFHCFVRNGTYADGAVTENSTVAEGDLTIIWNPLWQDAETGRPYTMKGEPGEPGSPGRKGEPGEKGEQGDSAYEVALKEGFTGSVGEWLKSLKGNPGSFVRVPALSKENQETGRWHKVYVKADAENNLRLVISKESVSGNEHESYIPIEGDALVKGTKTFEKPIVGTTTGNISVEGNQTIKGTKTFEEPIVGATTGNLSLSGGKITGPIEVENTTFGSRSRDDSYITLFGGRGEDKGAKLVLTGKDDKTGLGFLYLEANDGSEYVRLSLKPDGCVYLFKKDGSTEHLVRSVNNVPADDKGNVILPLNFLRITGGTMTGNIGIEKDAPWVAMKLTNGL